MPLQRYLAQFNVASAALFNFRQAHPEWKSSPSSQSLIGAVEDYSRNGALLRERDLYIEGATRQLDTLARLQSDKLKNRRVDLYPSSDTQIRSSQYTHGSTLDDKGSPAVEIGVAAPGTSNGPCNDRQRDEGVHHDLWHPGKRVLSSSEPLKHSSENPLSCGVSEELRNKLNKSTPEPGVYSPAALSFRGEFDSEQRAQRQVGFTFTLHPHYHSNLEKAHGVYLI